MLGGDNLTRWQINYDDATTLPNGWTVELYLAPGGLAGDLNSGNIVNALDLQLEVNVILGTETNSMIRLRADLNGDGTANALDLQRLVNLVLGI